MSLTQTNESKLPTIQRAKEGDEQMTLANHSETFLLELLDDYKIKSEENYIPLPTTEFFLNQPNSIKEIQNLIAISHHIRNVLNVTM